MILVNVLIEIKSNYLNRSFTYLYQLKKNIEVGVRVIVPFKKRTAIGYVIDVKKVNEDVDSFEKSTGFELLSVIDVLDAFPILNKELFSVAKEMSDYYLCSMISVLQTMLPPSLRPNSSSLKSPKINYRKYLIINNDIDINRYVLTEKQAGILNFIKKNEKVLKNSIKSNFIVKKLLKNELIKEIDVEEKRLKNILCADIKKEKKLTYEQQNAISEILNSKNKISLLEGVTGSGKTEVYLYLSKKIIESGKSVIILVPEIFLTSEVVKYFKDNFNSEIAVFHSRLTAGEKYDEYRYIASGKIKLVIGARSAIFAPVLNLGLIILDEEHSDNYKNNKTPFYVTHKVALMRAKINNSLVVFGSATPSLETKIKAIKGIYNYVKMRKRINQLPFPKTYIVDIRKQKSLSIISDFLCKKIKEKVLDNKEQVILLMNRRGFSTSVVCNECHSFFKCPNCGILLAFHKKNNFLKCHSCNFFRKTPTTCDYCNSKNIIKLGIGIEKVEQELRELFPNFLIARVDSDTVSDNKSRLMSKIIEDFHNRKIDILLGTQMIAKSYDFNNVTLAAIILADIGFSLPSFKRNENIFTLIVQMIGRSGRMANKQGEAIIQTFSPEHYIIKQACKQDYDAFFKDEMRIRKENQFPPYVRIISLILKSKNKNIVDDMSTQIFNDLVEKKFEDTTVLPPFIPYVPFENKKYLQKIIIKYKKNDDVKKYIKNNIMDFFSKKRNIYLSVDVDSFDF